MKSLFLSSLALLSCSVLFSQDVAPEVSNNIEPISDRPGLAFGASTIGKGSLMVDAGYYQQRVSRTEKRNYFHESYLVESKNNTMDYTMDVRYGLSSKVEMSFGLTYSDNKRTENNKEVDNFQPKNLVSNYRFRGRYTFIENWKFFNKVAFIGDFGWMPSYILPGLGEKSGVELNRSAMLVAEIMLLPKFTFTTNLGLGFTGEDSKYLIAVANLDYAMTPQFHGFIESQYPENNYIYKALHDVGVYYVISNKLQIDLAVSKGKVTSILSLEQDNTWLINAGLSWRPF